MLNSKSKKIGFLGTIFFHVILLLVFLLSSIGYTSVVIPDGIEIAYLPHEESVLEEDIIVDSAVQLEESDEPKVMEEMITEDVEISTGQDTINISELEIAEESSISSELEEALAMLNNMSSSNSDSISEDTDSVTSSFSDNSVVDDSEDGYILTDNRLALVKVKPKYLCQESGRVVVRVWVNREGITIKAEAGIRGTTESASCLLQEAKAAALQTKWTPYFNAPEIQIGQITYNFYRN